MEDEDSGHSILCQPNQPPVSCSTDFGQIAIRYSPYCIYVNAMPYVILE